MTQVLLPLQQHFPIDFSGASQPSSLLWLTKRFQTVEECKAFLTFLTIAVL